MASLTGISEEVKGRHIELDLDEVRLGRVAGNTVQVDNPTVSSRHCVITRENGTYVLKDLDSTNGTRVNARQVKEIKLSPKDTIQVGSVEFVFDDLNSTRTAHSVSLSTSRVTEEMGAGSGKPESFDSISPFGSAKKETRGVWFVILAVIGVAALAAVAYYFITLIHAS